MRLMQIKSTEEYCDELIIFYKSIKTEDKQLKKLIVRNLHDIKNRYLKEIAKYKQQEEYNELILDSERD